MQISSSILPVQLNPQPREQQGSARNQNTVRSEERQAADISNRESVEREAAAPGTSSAAAGGQAQRVEASTRSESSNFQRVRSFDELPLNSRNALDSYQSNAESSENASASQLAGVDVFV